MNKDLIKKYNLNEAIKRFNQINEYTFITSPVLSEDDDEQEGDDNQRGNQEQPVNGDGQNGQPPMNNQDGGNQPQDQSQQGEETNDANVGQNGDGIVDNNQQQGDENMPNFDFADDQDVEDTEMEGDEEPMQSGDQVVDIDDLTNSQETTEYKVDSVDTKIDRLLAVVDKFEAAIQNSNAKIEDLKADFERRNPTEQEKLNIRSQSSFPYAETPRQYWDGVKAKNPNYDVRYDNDVPADKEQQEFQIKDSDLNSMNYKAISDSLDANSFDIRDYLKF